MAFEPGAISPAMTASDCMTVLDRIREFSALVKKAVRITGPTRIEMVNPTAPLPTGWTTGDAPSLYSSTSQQLAAGSDVLSILSGDVGMSVTATLVSDDARLINSTWRIPDPLPIYGLGQAPIKRLTMTFTPTTLSASVEFVLPSVPLEVRRT